MPTKFGNFPRTDREPISVMDLIASLPPTTEAEREANRIDRAAWEAKYASKSPEDMMAAIMEDGLNDQFKVNGWKLKDIPWSTQDVWGNLLTIVGDVHLKIVSMNTTTKGQQTIRRGSVLISPEGMIKLERYVHEEKKESPG